MFSAEAESLVAEPSKERYSRAVVSLAGEPAASYIARTATGSSVVARPCPGDLIFPLRRPHNVCQAHELRDRLLPAGYVRICATNAQITKLVACLSNTARVRWILSPAAFCIIDNALNSRLWPFRLVGWTAGASGTRARVSAGAGQVLCGGAAVVFYRRGRGLGGRAAVENF